MTRVLITGSRSWSPVELIDEVLGGLVAAHGDDLVVVHGDCAAGVDAAFRARCAALGIRDEPHAPRWRTLGKRSHGNANGEMVAADADLCLVFHRDLVHSKVAGDCAKRALEAGIETWWYSGSSCEPRRIRSWADVMLGG